MLTTLKIMLKPNVEQEKQLYKSAGTARFVYNWALNIQLENYKKGGKFINDGDLRKQLTQLKQTEEYSWLYEVSNNIAKQAIKDLCTSYKNFFAKQKNPKTKGFTKKKIERAKRQGRELTPYDLTGHPKFKSKKYSKLSFYNDNVKLLVKDNKILIEKVGWIKTNEKIPMINETTKEPVKYYNPRISHDGKYWYLSVGIDKEELKVELRDISLGIDLGIKELAVTSENEIYPNINKTVRVRKLKKRLRRLQRQVSRKYEMNKTKDGKFRKTKNIIKLEKKIKLLHRRLSNIRNNNLHQVTTRIVKTKPIRIVMEDLNVKGMMKNKHLSKAIGEQCFNTFTNYVKYKSAKIGTEFIQTDRFYPSSKMCSNCFNIRSDLKLKDRTYICTECNLVIDRDYNASLNLSRFMS